MCLTGADTACEVFGSIRFPPCQRNVIKSQFWSCVFVSVKLCLLMSLPVISESTWGVLLAAAVRRVSSLTVFLPLLKIDLHLDAPLTWRCKDSFTSQWNLYLFWRRSLRMTPGLQACSDALKVNALQYALFIRAFWNDAQILVPLYFSCKKHNHV